jgi:RNA 2',3'-cyclic 3'-phosphodiesterase
MKRLFTAIRIQPDKAFLDQLHSLQQQLRHERIKWVEERNIHITLKFFGETEEGKIPALIDIQQKIAEKVCPFFFSLQNLGIFGSKYDPRVVWVGIEPYKELVGLMELFREELRKAGYEPDRQNLVPHLTIGRIKEIRDKELFHRSIGEFKNISSEKIAAKDFHLYESILRREGPEYRVIKTFPLIKSMNR